MKCPSCGNKGKPDSRPDPGVPAAFEFRGRFGTKVIVRCLQCDRGVFVRVFPPGYKAISADQWASLDKFWQLRRAEILADLQVTVIESSYAAPPPDEVVAESQASFVGTTQNRASFLHTLGQAGYEISDLERLDLVEVALIALAAREQQVIHDQYEEILAQGGVPQTPSAVDRIAAARRALSGGEESIRAFLDGARKA